MALLNEEEQKEAQESMEAMEQEERMEIIEQKLKEFAERVTKNAGKDWGALNISLPAGAPMYYGCKLCNAKASAMGELHIDQPPELCPDCENLVAFFATQSK